MADGFETSNSTELRDGQAIPALSTAVNLAAQEDGNIRKQFSFYLAPSPFDAIHCDAFGDQFHKAIGTNENTKVVREDLATGRYETIELTASVDGSTICDNFAREWAKYLIDQGYYTPPAGLSTWLTSKTGDRAALNATLRSSEFAGQYWQSEVGTADWKAWKSINAAIWATLDGTSLVVDKNKAGDRKSPDMEQWNGARRAAAVSYLTTMVEESTIHVRGFASGSVPATWTSLKADFNGRFDSGFLTLP